MKPNFESPVHTAGDLVEGNITLFMASKTDIWKQWLSQHYIPEYRKIAETMIISKSQSVFDEMTKNEMLNQGTHAQMRSYLNDYELELGTEFNNYHENYKYNRGRGYYRGEMLSGIFPGGGYLTNKKWHLNEVENEEKMSSLSLKPFTIWGCT